MKFEKSGLDAKLPKIETFPNQYDDYEITIIIPEYTSLCPLTGLPDFGAITIKYIPNKFCVELKSFKYYILGYRNLGICYENIVNRILNDFVAACKPKQVEITGDFSPRGGIKTIVAAQYPKKKPPQPSEQEY